MNRSQRRQSQKSGELKYLQTPCTLAEAAQIARGVAEDVVTDYQNSTGHLQIAMSLQLEILKDVVIKAGLITEEELKEKYIEQATIFNQMQQEALKDEESEEEEVPVDTKMESRVSEIEIKKV